jgi:hypothetical protein
MKNRPIVHIAFSLIFITLARANVTDAAHLDQGWRLWLDPKAAWQDDTLYLPEDVILTNLPVNPPSGGWDVLSGTNGVAVTLPSTVEEQYWSRTLSKDSTPLGAVEHNGSYTGVSWWYRTFKAPKLASRQRCLLEIGGSRLRAEVYLNGKLVGYNIITELPFTVDVTKAIKPGAENLLAIRLTNPGGQLAWDDTQTIAWGKYRLPMSHGFGGLDKGIRLIVRGESFVSDLAVLNTPASRSVKVLAGSGVESVIGYGRNHDPNVGVAAAIVRCGRGKIVLLALPGLMDSFLNSASSKFQPVTAKRLMFNALSQ